MRWATSCWPTAPARKVLYIHAEQFVSDVVKAYQRKTFDEFKDKYHSLDLLLIDDVQFFANKDRTQEEFFNAFEALLAKKSHIVMTSDTYPKGLADIHERLVSRFDSGLTVAIEPPELEMRVAILINKARAESSEMPEEVAFFVAKNVRSNVRELEGALRKILAYRRFNQKEISIQLAREALRDLLSIQNRQIGVENIQKTVADYYKIKVADMYSKKRPASIARPRQIAMYLAKELTQKSLPEIGELFGGRDHTTVLHAVRKIAAGAPERDRAEPAAARAGTDAEGMTVAARSNPVERSGTTRRLSTEAGAGAEVVPVRRTPRKHARPQPLPAGKCLMKKGKMRLVHTSARPYLATTTFKQEIKRRGRRP